MTTILDRVKISEAKTGAAALEFIRRHPDIDQVPPDLFGESAQHFILTYHDAPLGRENPNPSAIGWIVEQSPEDACLYFIAVAENLVNDSMAKGIVARAQKRWPGIDAAKVKVWRPNK